MVAAAASATSTYIQYVRQSRDVNGQSQDLQTSLQNKQADTIVKQATTNHLHNSQNVLRVRSAQNSRGNIVDVSA